MISTAVYTVFTSISLTTIAAFNHILITGHLSWHLFYLGFPILCYFLIHKVYCLLLSYIEFLDIFWVCISWFGLWRRIDLLLFVEAGLLLVDRCKLSVGVLVVVVDDGVKLIESKNGLWELWASPIDYSRHSQWPVRGFRRQSPWHPVSPTRLPPVLPFPTWERQ